MNIKRFSNNPKINDTHDYHFILENPDNISNFITKRINKKITWFFENRENYLQRYAQSDWKEKVIDFFYGEHLSLDVKEYGHIVAETDNVLIIDWENDCPILKRCLDQDVDLKMVCIILLYRNFKVIAVQKNKTTDFTDYTD
ncbi:MAG: hypothetical protein ACFFDN_41795, partial [Candidatus Hodarchaeota archaeon]